jgi:ATP-dependent protease ClpP protease subunit
MRQVLAQFKGKHIDMRISSYGGDLGDGLDIRQQLIDHGDVTVYLTGFVASAATVIAMGASRICMSKYAMFLVHKCSNFVDAWGNYNADQMQQLIDDLSANKAENDRIDSVIAQMYAEKCGKNVDEILDVLKEGRWLTAQQALDYGFIDEITENAGDTKINFTPELHQKFNMLGLPVQGIPVQKQDDSETSESMSILHRILNAVEKWSKPKEKRDDQSSQTNKPEVMNQITKFAAIMAAVGVSALQADADGAVTLSDEQMQAIEERLNSVNAELETMRGNITERNNEITSLKAQVENLKKLPGDDTSSIEDDAHEAMSSEDVFNFVRDL